MTMTDSQINKTSLLEVKIVLTDFVPGTPHFTFQKKNMHKKVLPAWTQDVYRPPLIKYSTCCPVLGGGGGGGGLPLPGEYPRPELGGGWEGTPSLPGYPPIRIGWGTPHTVRPGRGTPLQGWLGTPPPNWTWSGYPHPPRCGQTENITFPILRLRSVTTLFWESATSI